MKQIPSYKFLPLMYQLAARMGTKMANGTSEDTGFHDVLHDVRKNPPFVLLSTRFSVFEATFRVPLVGSVCS